MDLWEFAPAIDYLTNNLKAFAVVGRSELLGQAPCGISAGLMSSSQTLTSFVFSKLLALLVVIGKVVNLLCAFSLALESLRGFKRRGFRSLVSGRLYFWVKRCLRGLSVTVRPIFGWLEVGRLGQFQIERHLAFGMSADGGGVVPKVRLQISVC